MSKIKNTNQIVKDSYYTNFIAVFGDKTDKNTVTGKYVIDNKTGNLIKIDSNIPRHIKDEMEHLTSTVGKIEPINIQKKEI